MKLTQEEINSPCWRLVKEWAASELVNARAALEKDIEHGKSCVLRGKIRNLVSLLALENPAPTAAVEEEED